MNHHAAGRRALVLNIMQVNQTAGRTCASCTGKCCTFQANSMLITPLEAWDMMVFLRRQGRWTPELKKNLQTNVQRYRLNQDLPGDGQRSLMRRTYTCPFFAAGTLGCTISRSRKPVGCLAFNPKSCGVREGEDCGHGAGGEHFDPSWVRRNDRLRNRWGIEWEKLSIPLALLALFDIFGIPE